MSCNWYRDAKICIVHLAETTNQWTLTSDPWFTRGWTLQELLAPRRILFCGKSWGRITGSEIGNDKVPDSALGIDFWETISGITGIDPSYLLNFSAGINHARDALTWVSKRQTTRIEDMAYCLIGLLQIPMSIAYGEGSMAFHRLQLEILQRSGDMGLFAWTGRRSPLNSMLAADPSCFSPLPFSLPPLRPLTSIPLDDTDFTWRQPPSVDKSYMFTNKGLRIPLVVYSAELRSRKVYVQVYEFKKRPTEVVSYCLGLPELGREVNVVTMNNLVLYDHLGISILPGMADESSTIVILLGMYGNRCIRIPTQDHIVLSPIPPMEEPVIRFIE